MKIYSLPADLPEPTVDYANFDIDQVRRDEEAHKESLKVWLAKNGFSGEHTGKIYSTPVADGYAQYMFADKGGNGDALIHLPYGDAYQGRDVEFLPREEVLKRIAQSDRMAEIFAAHRSPDDARPEI